MRKVIYPPEHISEEAAWSQFHSHCSCCVLPCQYFSQVDLFVIIFPRTLIYILQYGASGPLLSEMWRYAAQGWLSVLWPPLFESDTTCLSAAKSLSYATWVEETATFMDYGIYLTISKRQWLRSAPVWLLIVLLWFCFFIMFNTKLVSHSWMWSNSICKAVFFRCCIF